MPMYLRFKNIFVVYCEFIYMCVLQVHFTMGVSNSVITRRMLITLNLVAMHYQLRGV
jgi:hypothetical protein